MNAGWWQFAKRLLVLLILIGVFVFWPFSYGWVSVCSICGRSNHVIQHQVPLVPVPWFTQSDIKSTQLSDFADTVLTHHEHQWQFINGNGNGMMGSGSGLVIDWAMFAEDALSFLKAAKEYDGPDEARLWLGRFLDPESSKHARFAALEFGMDGPFKDEEDYRTHRQHSDRLWEEDMD